MQNGSQGDGPKWSFGTQRDLLERDSELARSRT
jgi:hypothetical protein